MNSVKSIILLELLYKNSASNKEKLLDMFMRIVDETDIYKRVEGILNSNIFIGPEAAEWHRNLSNLLNEVRVNPFEAINIFFKLEEAVLALEKKQQGSEDTLKHLDFFEETPSVVSKITAATSTKFYEEFYKALTYFTVILYGFDGIKKWSEFPMGSFTDLVVFADKDLPGMVNSRKATKRKWSIVEKYYAGGRTGVAYNGCELIYEEDSAIVAIGPHKHPYLRIGEPGSKKMVEGFGYITGVSVGDVTSLFEGELINEVNVSNIQIDPLVIESNILYNPVEFLSKVIGTRKFILSPEAYVKLLNKYFLNRTIIERRSGSKCLLCGRVLSHDENDGICASHFDYTQN